MKIFAQKLLVGRTFLANQTVTVEDGQITAIGGGGPADFSVWALTPGLVDLHCHGGQGFDPELNERPLPEFLTILLCHGVTDVLLTLGAEPLPTMRINAVAEAYCSKQPHWPQGQGRPSLWVMICPSSGASPVGLRQHCPLMTMPPPMPVPRVSRIPVCTFCSAPERISANIAA